MFPCDNSEQCHFAHTVNQKGNTFLSLVHENFARMCDGVGTGEPTQKQNQPILFLVV